MDTNFQAADSGPSTRAQKINRIALVSMPFASADRPSIQLGLLKGLAETVNWDAEVFHFNLDLAALIGSSRYRKMAAHRGRQLGDWLFSVVAFGPDAPDPEGTLFIQSYPDAINSWLDELGDGADFNWLKRLRDVVLPTYISSIAEGFRGDRFDIVGFTSTFQQNAASFALARALKTRFPHLLTVFGGANFDGCMGEAWLRSVHCIDMVVVGEGDGAFPELLSALASGESPTSVAGVITRDSAGAVVRGPSSNPFDALDDLPIPDYTEFFARAERLGLLNASTRRFVDLPFEGARGCWWGAKHHCTFCGLNAETMRYRAKSPDRVLAELRTLSRRHQSFQFEAVDNIIDMRMFDTMLPVLAEEENGFNFFYEVKANLSRERIRTLALAGVRRVQPGIESFSTDVLKLMRKGISGIQNVNFLRWCRHEGIHVSWNLLWGFPGETADAYVAQAELLPKLCHLQPPGGGGRVWLERFSPLFREHGPAAGAVPEPSYGLVYPKSTPLESAAYFFDFQLPGALPDAVYEPLLFAMSKWSKSWETQLKPSLEHRAVPGFVEVEDRRDPANEGVHRFEGPLADLYQTFLQRPLQAGAALPIADYSEVEIIEALEGLHDLGLVMRDGPLWLSLSLPAQPRRRA